MPKFLLKFNAAVIKEIPVTKNPLTIGRKPDNDIVLDNPAVSGHHCKVYQEADTYYVEDLNSTNGTFVNTKKIVKSGLRHNDNIGIVQYILVFIDDRAQTANSTPAVPAAPPAPPPDQIGASGLETRVGILRVTSGLVDQTEYILEAASTYIGKSKKVPIKIKGILAPEVAATITRRPEGYYLCALKAGYPKLNGSAVRDKEPLKDGDQIEVGGTSFQFYLERR